MTPHFQQSSSPSSVAIFQHHQRMEFTFHNTYVILKLVPSFYVDVFFPLSLPTLLIRSRNCLTFASTWVHLRFMVGSVLFILLVFCAILLCIYVLGSMLWFHAWKRCLVRLYLQLFVAGFMCYLGYLFVCVYYVVLLFCFSSSVLPVSLDWPFLITSDLEVGQWFLLWLATDRWLPGE